MNRRNLWVSAALLVLAGCAKSFDPVPEQETVTRSDNPWVLKDLSSQMMLGPAEKHTVLAEYGVTRSTVVMNEAGTAATPVWSAGDTFEMYGYDSEEDALYYAPFTTKQGGSSVSFSTEYGLPDSAPYDVFYPGIDKFGFAGDILVYGINLPSEQKAVPGGIADGLAFSYASASNMTDPVHFKSMVSIVRFKMKGSLVSKVKSVTIKGTSPMAGDALAVPDGEGFVEVMQDYGFDTDVHSCSITLTGDFVVNQDYFLVLFPGTQPFKMVFADDEGHSLSKTASEFTFPRGQISDFGTIDLGDEFTDINGDTTPVQYMTATAGAPKPVTIAVIPDGFTANELDTYEMLAKSGIDALMATEPFNHYREYFNVWILKVASNESGANITDGNGNITTKRDCYFGSKWGDDENYDDMSANSNLIYDFVQKNCPDIKNGTHDIDEVPVLMIINDTRYGGICYPTSSGRGYCMAPYSYSGGKMYWSYPETEAKSNTASAGKNNIRQVTNQELQEMGQSIGDWRNTLVHEFGGHCFSRLGDEYWYDEWETSSTVTGHNWPVPFSLNISASYRNPGWKSDLLDNNLNALSSLTSKDSRYSRIGVYQGADVSMFNRWRSERVSCMIDIRFYFSTWQRMIIVKRIMTLSGSTFDADSFWAKDDPTDPLRDGTSNSSNHAQSLLPVRTVPMPAPPVLHENFVERAGL